MDKRIKKLVKLYKRVKKFFKLHKHGKKLGVRRNRRTGRGRVYRITFGSDLWRGGGGRNYIKLHECFKEYVGTYKPN